MSEAGVRVTSLFQTFFLHLVLLVPPEQMLDEGEGQLCKKKDIIIEKFDQLLRKLGGEELSLNISLGRMGAEWHAAMAGWLDSESTYRLRIEQVDSKENLSVHRACACNDVCTFADTCMCINQYSGISHEICDATLTHHRPRKPRPDPPSLSKSTRSTGKRARRPRRTTRLV
jgi:hypothetical protein